MKIKFKVHHNYGLAYEEVFTAEDLGIDWILLNDWKKENTDLSNLISRLLMKWIKKHYYYHDDALPSWEIINE